MVASLRCNELKEEALEKVALMIHELREKSENERIQNFAEECKLILKSAANHFDEYGRHYEKSIYDKVRKELLHTTLVQQQLYICFDNQMKLLRQQVFEMFDRELRRILRGGDAVCEDFSSVTHRLFTDFMNLFTHHAAELLI